MPDQTRAQNLQSEHEIRPDTQSLTHNQDDPSANASSGVDYTPHPDRSVPMSPENEKILKSITALYSGSASREDMEVYAPECIYDDPWSYCDTRYKVAGQWYGIPKIMTQSQTLATETLVSNPREIIYKQTQQYTPRTPLPNKLVAKPVDSLITLTLDEQTGKIKYHKDMWNQKDYSHRGLGKVLKELNGDFLTGVTRPEGDL